MDLKLVDTGVTWLVVDRLATPRGIPPNAVALSHPALPPGAYVLNAKSLSALPSGAYVRNAKSHTMPNQELHVVTKAGEVTEVTIRLP